MQSHDVLPVNWQAQIAQLHGRDYQLSALFANDERALHGVYAIYAVFFQAQEQDLQLLRLPLSSACLSFPSITAIFPGAAWYEREIHDLFGLSPAGHPDLRPLVLHHARGVFPLRKDAGAAIPPEGEAFSVPRASGDGLFETPVGPIHAGIIEPGHFRFTQAGENVLHLEARLFYTHRGVEKAMEGRTVSQALHGVERVCGACSVTHAMAFCQAIETLCHQEIPLRAAMLRLIACELERLYNHLGDMGNLCAGVGFHAGVSIGSRLKEDCQRWNERLTGHRFLRSWIVPGGVSRDISDKDQQELLQFLGQLEEKVKDFIDLLAGHDALSQRTETTGILAHKAALELGVVGPAARASGVDVDLRRDLPYGAYQTLLPRIPVRKEGDVAARLFLRADEAQESLLLLVQALRRLPAGPIQTPIPPLPPPGSALGWAESPRGGEFIWLQIDSSGHLSRLFLRSASYPNWMAVPLTVPGNIIPDFPLINKSFELCYACLDR